MSNGFASPLQKFVQVSKYARWLEEEGRRETWKETVGRWGDFFEGRFKEVFPRNLLTEAIESCDVMPSMRSLMTAGKALERDEMAGYNCSYVAIDSVRAFDEILYILACGTGVGFSVERQNIAKLPLVAEEIHPTDTTIVVRDSKIGWASAYRELISLLYSGLIPKWDVSKVRKKGERLKTFGGRASGPDPLVDLFKFTIEIFKRALGRRLTSLECHDIVCKIADSIVSGGVRRSALISLSNLSDDRMRGAKTGMWWESTKYRENANNSAVYTERPEMSVFFEEWKSLYDSKSGERGIFNRQAALKKAQENGRRDTEGWEYGTNPCGEILIRSMGLCNLSETVARAKDTVDDLIRKVKIATIIGTFQSTLTNFRYVRAGWKKNAEEERLLGVSITGIQDSPLLNLRADPVELAALLDMLRQVAIDTNAEWADKLGIPRSVAILTVKPSGTVSSLVDSAAGIHRRHSNFYIRTVRSSKTDAVSKFMRTAGFPVEDSVSKPDIDDVFFFPVKAPEGAVTREEFSAIQILEHYKIFRKHWCEHNPSITVNVKEHEWLAVGDWVFNNFDDVGGVSFLPYSGGIYAQAPYTECSEEEYEALLAKMPKDVDWDGLNAFETEDTTTGSRELACSAGVCEIL